jgi:hypothetical protein
VNIEPCAVCGSVASRASQHYSWCSSLECEMNKVSLSPALWNRIQVALREQAEREGVPDSVMCIHGDGQGGCKLDNKPCIHAEAHSFGCGSTHECNVQCGFACKCVPVKAERTLPPCECGKPSYAVINDQATCAECHSEIGEVEK